MSYTKISLAFYYNIYYNLEQAKRKGLRRHPGKVPPQAPVSTPLTRSYHMSSLPHPVPSRTAHAIAALYGHEDETLVAWQRSCAHAAGTLRAQHDSERLTKALALAQGGHVAL